MPGYATITLEPLPTPVVPEGWALAGYAVEYDGPTERQVFAPTVAEGVKEMERMLDNLLRVRAECTRRGKDDTGAEYTEQMQCHWLNANRRWSFWRPA